MVVVVVFGGETKMGKETSTAAKAVGGLKLVQVFKFELRLLLMEVDLYQGCTRFLYQDLEAKNEKDEGGMKGTTYFWYLLGNTCSENTFGTYM